MTASEADDHGLPPGADLRITALDRAMAALGATTGPAFHLVLDFDGPLDPDRLEAAWQQVGRRFPVLRGHADLGAGQTEWALDPALPPVDFVIERAPTAGLDVEPERLMAPGPVERPLLSDDHDLATGPLSRLAAIDRGGRHRLVWTTNHVLIDGASSVEVIDALAGWYRGAGAGPLPAPAPDPRSRSLAPLLRASGIGPTVQAEIVARYLRHWAGPRRADHALPRSTSDESGYACADVTSALDALDAERRHRGWRASAILLVLVSQAWDRVFDDGRPHGDVRGWQLAGNLRAELDGGDACGLGNLSGTDLVSLSSRAPSLRAAIDEANRAMGALATQRLGLGSALLAERSAALPFGALRSMTARSLERVAALGYQRSFSNVGPWPATAIDWGGTRLVRSCYLPGVSDPRWPVVAVHAVGGRSWLSMRTQRTGVGEADVAALAAAMVELAATQ